MKKYISYVIASVVILLISTFCNAQGPIVFTIAGTAGYVGSTGDGGPATAARLFGNPLLSSSDGMGNVFIVDGGNMRIRKVDAAGIITTIAGGGTVTTDGVYPAYARLFTSGVAVTDGLGNLYLVDSSRIRKISASTGLISTIAGTGVAGFSGDGGPAAAAQLYNPRGLCFDAIGNLYVADRYNNRVRKINTAGIITTIAGTGVTGFSGDGGPAASAQLRDPCGVTFDAAGNLYIADRSNDRIRKISADGTITTYAGNGFGGSTGDGGPATDARLESYSVAVDSRGNLYIDDGSKVRTITPDGIINTFGGGGSSTASGIPITSASFSNINGIFVDCNDNMYISDGNYRVCEVNLGIPTVSADSFYVSISNNCSGMNFKIVSNSWSTGMHVKSFLGNGQISDNVVNPAGTGGVAYVFNAYTAGIYTVKHILYNGSAAIDSISYTRNFKGYNNFGITLYYDANGDCVKEAGEPYASGSVTLEVDSAGIAIDTIPAMGGSYYTAYGEPGTVYQFKLLSYPSGAIACGGGVITDTINIAGSSNVKNIGLACVSGTDFDLQVFPSFRAGPDHFRGTIIVDNANCLPQSATLTMQLSPKYNVPVFFRPAPTSSSGNIITWDLGTLSSVMTSSALIYMDVERASGVYPAYGDTVMSYCAASPVSGDHNPADNTIVRKDTVKSGYDPNDIAVTPDGCIGTGGHRLQYTIHFENTGNDTAFNISVLDTLPPSLNPHSVQIIASSATMFTSVIKSGGYNILKFDFPSINLPDSSHHGLCDGMVVFSVDMNSGLADGTAIPNRAGIYFDYNPVVLTNTATNTVGCDLSVPGMATTGKLKITPNPATDYISITAEHPLDNATISISDMKGRLIITEAFKSSLSVNTRNWPKGVYIVTLNSGSAIVRREKVIIE